MQSVKSKLSRLKLAGIAKTIESRNRYAIDNQMSYIEFIELLLEDEILNRQSNRVKKFQSRSKLDMNKTLNDFEFAYQPELNKKALYDLATARFITDFYNIVFMGKPGVGKSHLANAIGIEAIKQGYEVMFVDASDMLFDLYRSKIEGAHHKILQKYIKPDLLIIDEIGFKELKKEVTDDLFEIVKSRYEKKSIIITTNRNFEDWGLLFGDQVLASAILDRLLHHAHIFKLTGESYRMKQYTEKKAK